MEHDEDENDDDDLLSLLLFFLMSFRRRTANINKIIRRSRTRTAITIIRLYAAMPKYC